MKSILSFVIGAAIASLFFVMFANTGVTVDNQSVTSNVEKTIALVNLDTGIEGQDINIAESMINNLYEPEEYQLVSTTLEKAQSGLEGNSYSAYIIFDANYSESIYGAMNEELPSKSKIQYKVNKNLTNQEISDVKNILLKEMMYIDNTTNYMFINYLLNTVHYSQDEVSKVLENEAYVNKIMTEAHEYNEVANKNATNYIENPRNMEITLDDTVIDELYATNLETMEDTFNLDTKELQEEIVTSQNKLNTELSNYRINPDISIEGADITIGDMHSDIAGITLEEDLETSQLLIDMLNSSVSYSESINTNNSELLEELSELNRVLNDMVVAEETEFDITVKTINSLIEEQNISGLEAYLSTNKYAQFILDFQESYDYWLANPESCDLETEDPLGCMKPFIDDVNTKDIVGEYDEFMATYQAVEKHDRTYFNQLAEEIKVQIDSLPIDYDNYVQMVPFVDVQDAYRATKNYCRAGTDDNISQFVCVWIESTDKIRLVYDENVKIYKEHNDEILNSKENIGKYNESVQMYVSNKNNTIEAKNQSTLELLLMDQENQIHTVQNVEQTINDKLDLFFAEKNMEIDDINTNKDKFTLSTSEMLDEIEKKINNTLDIEEESKLASSVEIQEYASSYIESYPKLSNSLAVNQESLVLFEQLMSNTRNSNDANYYMYDYLSNPLEIRDETGEIINTIVVEEPESMLYPITILSFIILLSGLGYLFHLRKNDGQV